MSLHPPPGMGDTSKPPNTADTFSPTTMIFIVGGIVGFIALAYLGNAMLTARPVAPVASVNASSTSVAPPTTMPIPAGYVALAQGIVASFDVQGIDAPLAAGTLYRVEKDQRDGRCLLSVLTPDEVNVWASCDALGIPVFTPIPEPTAIPQVCREVVVDGTSYGTVCAPTYEEMRAKAAAVAAQ